MFYRRLEFPRSKTSVLVDESELIGEGAFGCVYRGTLARLLETQKYVAVKKAIVQSEVLMFTFLRVINYLTCKYSVTR